MNDRYYAHWELRNMIYAQVRGSGARGMTRTQISRALGRSKAQHISATIEELVTEGTLVKVNLKRSSQDYFLYFSAGAARDFKDALGEVLDKA